MNRQPILVIVGGLNLAATEHNQLCYGQVDSPYGSGQFIKDLLRLQRGQLLEPHVEDFGSLNLRQLEALHQILI